MRLSIGKYAVAAAVLFFVYAAPAYAANTYATWNAGDKSTNTTLSNGNLTATHAATGNAYNGVRSDLHKTSGKWYWEYSVGTIGADNALFVGLYNSTASLTTTGGAVNKWNYLSQGCSENNGTETCGFASYVAGDFIGVAYDAGAQTVQFYKNCVSQFTLTSVTADGYAGLNFFDNNDAVTANFGATALHCSTPVGFNSGLYTPGATTGVNNSNLQFFGDW
jgi:hypothetical protein